MNLLPKATGTRPRLACEISPESVVAARAADLAAPVEEVAGVALAAGAVAPGLKPGNLVDRVAVVTAIRRALEEIGVRPNARNADLTLIVPDAAVRVLLLDFDALPGKLTEALPIVRFRLKKLLPFEADDAMISFQVMSSSRNAVRVLAVAMPRDVLSEYETAVREAGYEPGAVLPSTLAVLPAIPGSEPVLIANAAETGITTAIVREGVLLLHRSVDLQLAAAGDDPVFHSRVDGQTEGFVTEEIAQAISVAAAYFEDTLAMPPATIFSAGSLGAEELRHILTVAGVAETDGLHVRELIESAALLPGAISASVSRSALAGVVGALRG